MENQIDTLKRPEIEQPPELTDQEAETWILRSFLHSRGFPILQGLLLGYISSQAPRTFSRELFVKLNSKNSELYAKVKAYVQQPKIHLSQPEADIWSQYAVALNWLRDFYKPVPTEDFFVATDLMPKVAEEMLPEELYYLGSPESEHGKGVSFLREYGFLGKKTGNAVIDQFYTDFIEFLKTNSDPKITRNLGEVVQLWEELHPGEKFFAEVKG
jgi:hypothetical protein